MTPDALRTALHGRVSLPWEDEANPGRPLVLEAFRPPNHRPGNPVVFVQHGMNRNGDEYRDAWIQAADRHGLLIVAPSFPAAHWPGARPYNDGHVRDEDGTPRPRAGWSNAIPGRVFRRLQEAGITTRPRAFLWGHSAGGQFVHRLLALHGADPWEAVGAANAGWYTQPTLDAPYPEGLGGLDLGEAGLRRFLQYPLTVFAGDRDTDEAEENLPRHPAAQAQGPHRFARAGSFVAAGRAAAARLGVACAWTLVIVPGIGHEGMRMSAAAAGWWFDGALPGTEAGRMAGREA